MRLKTSTILHDGAGPTPDSRLSEPHPPTIVSHTTYSVGTVGITSSFGPLSLLRSTTVAVGVLAIACSAGIEPTGAANDPRDVRLPWGDPDLQGIWVNNENTPLERPDPTLDAARLAALAQWFPGGSWGGVAGVNEPIAAPADGARRALVVDPPGGRIPVKAAAEEGRDRSLQHLTDSWDTHTLWERCITRGTPLLPSNYNNGYQIVQTEDYVTITHEMIHEFRIIPLSERSASSVPDVPDVPDVPQWMGHGRGHWDGDTLVVETSGFAADTILASSLKSLAMRGLPHSGNLRVVERFTRATPGVLDYEVTIDDPDTYTQPWTATFSLDAESEYVIYEYACHEGNYGLANTLRGARVAED